MLANLQRLGRALMLPVAVLPVAGLLLRLGQGDLWTWLHLYAGLAPNNPFEHDVVPFIGACADAIFSHLGLLFGIGVAVGFAKENHGAAGLAGVVCYLVATSGAAAVIQAPPDVVAGLPDKLAKLASADYANSAVAHFSVPCGILSGLAGGLLYNRFYDIKLPDYLAFFGGRRFVPIVSGLAGLLLGGLFGWGWPVLSSGLDGLTHAVVASGDTGLFIFGVLNRLLLVTGLHHVLNNVAWFVIGDFHGKTGDLNRFFAGDPTAGVFMTGFFPVMMFGLPAACFAMYRAAPRERRKEVGGMLTSMALTSFLTGVTEPIEFSFMFLAPLLYALHAVLTGIAMVVMHLLHVRLGFSFSAGLFDFVLNYNKGSKVWMIIPIGLIYAVVYYAVFSFAIRRFGLKTPGRDDAPAPAEIAASSGGGRIDGLIAALGGAVNLKSVDACTTRLRLEVANSHAVDEAALKAFGSRGLIRPSATTVQVVLGPTADQTAGDIRARLATLEIEPALPTRAAAQTAPVAKSAPAADPKLAAGLLAALGGASNVTGVQARAGRVRVEVADDKAVDEAQARQAGARGVARPASQVVHLIVGPAAEGLAGVLAGLVRA
ncbi:MAG TPA: N-acetylglucosamine-specific PTS transporter subunit IIBC [Caulobacteraceae bacterium]|jgi:PTS system N-acetylglucosamine-specific IIC component|nr:N-acetylglucosamine-specific PTS transporter subunit IIBC [Caulobacteraceae bacterium]